MAQRKMANTFLDSLHGQLIELAKAIEVSDPLLAVLLDKGVLTLVQHDEIRVRCFC